MTHTRPFTLYKRNDVRRPVYYVRFRRPDGSLAPARSTQQTTRSAAERWALDYLEQNGRPTLRMTMSFDAWARDFWKENSRYVRLRRAHGYSLSAYHVKQQDGLVRNYLLPEFGSYALDKIATEHIENFLLDLKERGVSPFKRRGKQISVGTRTVNRIRGCLKQMLAEAVRLGYLKRNPAEAVMKFKEHPRVRGILSHHELWQLLFRQEALSEIWNGDRLHHLFVVVAAVTGARQGELRALRAKHVHSDYIEINHGWDDALNAPTESPKWGHRRVAPIPPKVAWAIETWLGEIGAGSDDWVFPSATDSSKPITTYTIQRQFRQALSRVGIPEEQREKRNIVFHSLRHSFVTALRAGAVDTWQARATVGHRTDRMFDHYSDHAQPEHLTDVRSFQTLLIEKPAEVRQTT